MSKCTISFNDNENGIYYVGQTMSGTVELYLPEAKKCRGLRLAIEGAAKCKWTEQKGVGKNSYTETYRGREQYLNYISYLFGGRDGESEQIEAGVHSYSFSCFLPLELPYSVEAAHGYIRYKVEANLDIPWGVDDKMVKEFTVCRLDDLNLYPDLKISCHEEDIATFCCLFCESKPLLFEVSIPHSGYVPGDAINVAIKVTNKSNATVPKCQIELHRNTKYTSEENETKIKSEVMVKVEAQGVEKRTTVSFVEELVVPSILTSTNEMYCNVFQITYEIKVICKTRGCSECPVVTFPITLGSVPLNFGEALQPMSSFEQTMNQT